MMSSNTCGGFALVVAVAAMGSIIFLLLPGSSDSLYIRAHDQVGWTRITNNEWVWMVSWSLIWLLLVLLGENGSPWWCCFSSKSTTLTRETSCGAPPASIQWFRSERTVFHLLLVVNLIWIACAIYPLPKDLLNNNDRTTTVLDWLDHIGAKAAWPALWNVAIVAFPIQRTLPTLHSSRQVIMSFHAWASYALLFWLAVHTILLVLVSAMRVQSVGEWFSTMLLPHKNFYTEGVVNFTGWLGLLFCALIWLSARPSVVTAVGWESFGRLHLLLVILFVTFSNLHDYSTLFFIQPALIGWTVDRFHRRCSTKRIKLFFSPQQRRQEEDAAVFLDEGDEDGDNDCVDEGTILIDAYNHNRSRNDEADVSRPTVVLTLSIPRHWHRLEPGMFVYIKVKKLGQYQSHPFSISSIDVLSRTFTLHVKALGDWTATFSSYCEGLCSANEPLLFEEPVERNGDGEVTRSHSSSTVDDFTGLCWEIEGPYGPSSLCTTLRGYRHCIFIAGGVGLTGISALAHARHQFRQSHPLMTTNVVWLARNEHDAAALMPLLEPLRKETAASLDVRSSRRRTTKVYIHFTQQNDTTSMSALEARVDRPDARATTSTTSRSWRARYETQISFPCLTLLSAVMSMVFSLYVSRLVFFAQSFHDAELGIRMRNCSVVLATSTCATCDIENIGSDGLDMRTSQPCCTVPVCYYGFRSAPVLLSLLFVPVGTFVLSFGANSLWLFLRQGFWREHLTLLSFWQQQGALVFLRYQSTPTQTHQHQQPEDLNLRYGEEEEMSAAFSNEFQVECGPVSVPVLLARSLQSHRDDEDDEGFDDVAVVVCGPEPLVQAVQHEVSSLRGCSPLLGRQRRLNVFTV